jgi:hypothetical protein
MPDVLYKIDGVKVTNHNQGEDQATGLFDVVKEKFTWFDKEVHRAVSQAYHHEILGEQVIRTCVVMKYAEEVLDDVFGTAHRLFGMDSGTSMFYVTKLFQGTNPAWCDENMFILSFTEHHEELNRPCSPNMLGFTEYFFVASPEKLAEMEYDLTDVNDDTLFSVLTVNDEIVAKRRYTNFVEDDAGVLANWQTMYVMYAKKARRMDLVRSLFSKSFVQR